jgi:hypothetical protein
MVVTTILRHVVLSLERERERERERWMVGVELGRKGKEERYKLSGERGVWS